MAASFVERTDGAVIWELLPFLLLLQLEPLPRPVSAPTLHRGGGDGDSIFGSGRRWTGTREEV